MDNSKNINCKYVRKKEKKKKNSNDDRVYEFSDLEKKEKNNRKTSKYERTDNKRNIVENSKYIFTKGKDNTLQASLFDNHSAIEEKVKYNQFMRPIIIALIYLYIASVFLLSASESTNSISNMCFVLLAVATIINMIVMKSTFTLRATDMMMLLFALYVVISSTWTVCDTEVDMVTGQIPRLVLLFFIIRFNTNTMKDLRIMIDAVCLGTVLLCLYTLYFYGIGFIINSVLTGGRIGGEVLQANGIGMLCALTNTVFLYRILYEKKYIFIIPLLPVTFILTGTGSRKGILMFLIGIFLLIFFRAGKKKVIALVIITILSVVFVNICFKYRNDSELFKRLANLFDMLLGREANLDASLDSRVNMIDLSFRLFKQKPLQGFGPAQYEYYYALEYGTRRPPHSTYLQFLISFGVMGSALFYGTYVFYIKNSIIAMRRRVKYSVLFITLIILMLFNDLTANMLNTKYLYIFVAIFSSYADIIKRAVDGKLIEENMKRGFSKSLKSESKI